MNSFVEIQAVGRQRYPNPCLSFTIAIRLALPHGIPHDVQQYKYWTTKDDTWDSQYLFLYLIQGRLKDLYDKQMTNTNFWLATIVPIKSLPNLWKHMYKFSFNLY